MRKIFVLSLFFNFILVYAQDKVVTKNGKEIEVNKGATTSEKGIVKLAGDLSGTADAPTVPALANKENTIAPGTTSQYWRGDKTWQIIDKFIIGLGNVDNTADVDKPISTATQTALDTKENAANKSTATTLGTSDVLFPTQNAVKTYVDDQIGTNATPDATTLVKGKIQLAGDLGGTADAPTVPALANKENTIAAGTTSQYWRGDKTWQTLDKSAVGLENVDNTADVDKPISTAVQTALSAKEDVSNKSTTTTLGTSDVLFPTQNAVKTYVDAQIGTNATPDATTISKGKIQLAGDLGGTADAPTVPALANKENTIAAGITSQYWRGDKTWQTLDKSAVGLGNVDNTSDLNKPISTATQTALNTKENNANKSTATTLGTSNVLYPSQNAVKTYVDNKLTATVVDATSTTKGILKLTGDLGGTADLPTVPALANKENTIAAGTTSQYWRGDKTWQTLDKSAVGLGNVDNTSDLNKPISTATQTALNTKENAANKSDVTTLGTSDVLFPTQNAVKTYVDTQINTNATPDATALVKGKIQLAGDLAGTGSTATNPVITNNAITTSKIADAAVTPVKIASGSTNSVLVTDATGAVTWIDKGAFGAVADMSTIEGAGTTASPFKVKDLGIITAKLADGAVTTIKLADDAVTNAKIGETITVANGGTGATSLTGYVKGNGTSAFTAVSPIPVTDVDGAVRSVNGILPDNITGNVAVAIGRVFTGTTFDPNLATSVIAINTDSDPSNDIKESDIYIISGQTGATNDNGRTFIYDGTTWLEISTSVASLENTFVKLSGSTMSGNLVFPTGKKIQIADAPTGSTDVTNKAYVDGLITSSTTPDADATTKGKLKLTNDLGGTADAPTVPGLALKAPINSPSLTGTPLAPTATPGTNTTQIATTEFVTEATSGLQDAITLTTTGTGAATLVGATLNIPTPNNASVTDVNALTIGTSGTDITSTVVNPTTSPEITLNVPTASAANRGALSAADWTTFNDKIGGSGTVNFVPKFSAAKTLTDSSIFDNGTNVGIGTTSPANTLEITQGTAGNSGLRFTNLTSSSSATTASSKVLGLNNNGDVILTNVPGTQNIVAFSTATPTTSGVVFTPNTPSDQSVVYQSTVDNSLWTYNGSTYLTYTPPSTTPFFLANTSNDAGSNKTSPINRPGSITVDSGFVRANSGNYSLTMNAAEPLGPRFQLGTLSGTPGDFFEIGAYNSKNNFDTKSRDLTIFSTLAPNMLHMSHATGRIGINTTTSVGRLIVDDRSYIAALPATSANLQDNTIFRPHTRFQNTVGINNNGLSIYSTTGAWGIQAHHYSFGTALPLVLQPAVGNVGIGAAIPGNKLEITQGTAGNSGLRFTNLTSASAATTTTSKVLGLNSTGDVILTNVPGTQSIVAFSTATPTTSGVVFTPNTPTDQSVVYQSSTDNSLWTYNGTTYVTYTPPSSTAWFTAGTTNDAGNSKTSNIYRSGNVGVGVSSPIVPLDVQSPSVSTFVSTARFLTPNNTTPGNANSLAFGVSTATQGNAADFRYVYQGSNATSNRVDFGMSGNVTPMMSYLNSGNVGIGTTNPTQNLTIQRGLNIDNANANTGTITNALLFGASGSGEAISSTRSGSVNQFGLNFFTSGAARMAITSTGNVGIGTTAPSALLHVFSPLTTSSSINANAQMLRLQRPELTGTKWGGLAQFNLGSYDGGPGAASRLDLAMANGANNTLSDIMTWHANGNVGIGSTAPANRLEITQGTAGNSGLRFTNLTSASTATTTTSKVLSLNSTGDVILTNVPGTQSIVAFSTATPTTSGVVFTPNTPTDQSVVYQSAANNSLWTYNGTTYVTYTPPSSTAWFTAGTTNDAGNSKTANIYRTGNVGIGTTSPSTLLTVGTFDDLNTTKFQVNGAIKGNANGGGLLFFDGLDNQVFRGLWGNFGLTPATHTYFQMGGVNAAFSGVNGGKMNSIKMLTDQFQISTGTALNTPTPVGVFEVRNATTPFMNILASGNVGIGTTAPVTTLQVQNTLLGTATINADAQVLRLSRIGTPSAKWDNIAQFNLGSYSTAVAANTRLDLVMNNVDNTLLTAPVMTWQASGNVGIGTTSPTSRLDVASGTTDVARFTTSLTGANYSGIGIGNGSGIWGKIASGNNQLQIRNFTTDEVFFNVQLATGNVGIGTTSPVSKLEVNGAATNTTAFNAAAGTSIDFSKSNLAYTTASAGAFTLTNLKDGGTYTLAVQGATSGTASFSGTNPSATPLTFRLINNGATAANKHTIYTFLVMGTTVYVYMSTGF